jgi:hypothetical protein
MNRYAQRMKRFAQKNRQAKEIADAYIDKYGTDNRVKLGKVVNEQIRLAVFDLLGEIEEIREDPAIKSPQIADMLYKLSRGLKGTGGSGKTEYRADRKHKESRPRPSR